MLCQRYAAVSYDHRLGSPETDLREELLYGLNWNVFGSDALSAEISAVLSQHDGDAERINDSVQSAPSKRLEAFFSQLNLGNYDKVANGTLILKGNLVAVRQACPRFDQWLCWLESLA